MPEARFPRSFADRMGFSLPATREFVALALREGSPARRHGREAAARVPYRPRKGPLHAAGDATRVTWIGHASVVIQTGGLTILADPVWSERIPGLPRFQPAGLRWEHLPRVDALLVSHNHYDHLDAPTVNRLPRDTPVLAPANLGAWFRARGFSRVIELDWWESAEVEGVRFDFVPSQHWSRRTLVDANRSLWGGWVVTPPEGPRVWFAGDSGYAPWFAEIGKRYPGIDVACLPIGAYDPPPLLRGQHMSPEEAVRAFLDAGARRLVPIHWGTFPLTYEPPWEPVERLRAEWARLGLARERLWDLAVGETREA